MVTKDYINSTTTPQGGYIKAIQGQLQTSGKSSREQDFSYYNHKVTFPNPDVHIEAFPYCPISPTRFNSLLDGFPKRTYVVQGFSQGFITNFQGDDTTVESHNSNSATKNPEVVDNLIGVELESHRLLGPYQRPPFKNYKVMPISIREKSTPGKFRLLRNLTYPYDSRSVNLNIPHEFTTVQYAGIQEAINIILNLGKGCNMAKSDIKNAYRHVPIHPSQHHLMGFKWKNQYYFDKYLAMGLSESCKIFETVSDAILHILKHRFGINNVVKILDDFLFLEKTVAECKRSLNIFLQVAQHLGFAIALDKTTTNPSTTVTFLGIKLDSQAMTASLPQDKLFKYAGNINKALDKQKITIAELRTLVGQLQFATCVVKGGRPFLRRLIDLSTQSDKPYWHVRLSEDTKSDLRMWLHFLYTYNGVTMIKAKPITPSSAINLFSDASKLGFGATYGSDWIQGRWTSSQTCCNIAVLELYPIFLLIHMFKDKIKGSRIIFHCDNQAIVHVLNKQSSRDKDIMALLRPLILVLLKNDISFIAQYIPSEDNYLADTLSRFQETPEILSRFGMKPSPTPIPELLSLSHYVR